MDLGQHKVMVSQGPYLSMATTRHPGQKHPEPATSLSPAAAWPKQAQDLRKGQNSEQEILAGSIQLEISDHSQELKKIIHKSIFPLLSKDLPLIF